MSFFQWLDTGRGALVDLPEAPRRFLDEGVVLYLPRPQLAHFEVEIIDGKLRWKADGRPVDLPHGALPAAAAALVDDGLATSRRREKLVDAARGAATHAAFADIARPSAAAVDELLKPLVAEGLLRELRDPLFSERSDAKDSEGDVEEYDRLWTTFMVSEGIFALPDDLPADLTWARVLDALDHDDGRDCRKRPLQRVADRARGGIFVVDIFGKMRESGADSRRRRGPEMSWPRRRRGPRTIGARSQKRWPWRRRGPREFPARVSA